MDFPYVDPAELFVFIAVAASTLPGAESRLPVFILCTRSTGVADRRNRSAVGVADRSSSIGVSCSPPCNRGCGRGNMSDNAIDPLSDIGTGVVAADVDIVTVGRPKADVPDVLSMGDNASDRSNSEDV